MCLVCSTRTADEGFAALRAIGQGKWEADLAAWADEENAEVSGAHEHRLYPIKEWGDIPQLKKVRKAHIGRHRIYSVGHRSECRYTIVYVMVHKREEEDTPAKRSFQNSMIARLQEPVARVLEVPQQRADENEE